MILNRGCVPLGSLVRKPLGTPHISKETYAYAKRPTKETYNRNSHVSPLRASTMRSVLGSKYVKKEEYIWKKTCN